KLLRHGEGWLSAHPERPLIATRYLKYRRNLVDDALAQLEEVATADARAERNADEEVALESSVAVIKESEEPAEPRTALHDLRLGTVLAALKASGAASVLDLGCGEGRLLRHLLAERQFTRITGMDVSHRALSIAADPLPCDCMAASRE